MSDTRKVYNEQLGKLFGTELRGTEEVRLHGKAMAYDIFTMESDGQYWHHLYAADGKVYSTKDWPHPTLKVVFDGTNWIEEN